MDEDDGSDDRPATRRTGRQTLRELAKTLLLAVGIYLGVQLIVPPYAVEGASMDPNLQDGERLLVNRPVYAHFDANKIWNLLPGVERDGESVVYPFHAPERGEVVVFRPPVDSDKPYIKRVIGLPGDSVTMRGGDVYINRERLDEPYLDRSITFCDGRPHCRLTVPEGMVYVLGDNRDDSSDSRTFGPVDVDAIVGQAWFANWPLDAIGFIE